MVVSLGALEEEGSEDMSMSSVESAEGASRFVDVEGAVVEGVGVEVGAGAGRGKGGQGEVDGERERMVERRV